MDTVYLALEAKLSDLKEDYKFERDLRKDYMRKEYIYPISITIDRLDKRYILYYMEIRTKQVFDSIPSYNKIYSSITYI